MFDVSDEFFLRQQLNQKELELEQQHLKSSQLIRRLSDDLQNPIKQLIQFSHISLMRLKRNELSSAQNYLSEIKMISEELLLYLAEIKEMALLRAGQEKFNLDEIDAKIFLKKIQKKFLPIAEAARVSLLFHLPAGGLYILADSQKIEKVTNIVLSRAIESNREKGHVIVKIFEEKKYVKICIIDDGTKVDEMSLYQYHYEKKYRQEGHKIPGFNLGVCKELICGQGGDIELDYDVKFGNIFTLKLPCVKNF